MSSAASAAVHNVTNKLVHLYLTRQPIRTGRKIRVIVFFFTTTPCSLLTLVLCQFEIKLDIVLNILKMCYKYKVNNFNIWQDMTHLFQQRVWKKKRFFFSFNQWFLPWKPTLTHYMQIIEHFCGCLTELVILAWPRDSPR